MVTKKNTPSNIHVVWKSKTGTNNVRDVVGNLVSNILQILFKHQPMQKWCHIEFKQYPTQISIFGIYTASNYSSKTAVI